MITREEALKVIQKYIKTENTIKHMLATEAIMRALARKLEPDKEAEWAMTGLLHDIDYEVAKDRHPLEGRALLEKEKADLPEEVYQAILAHGYGHHPECQPESKMDWALTTCDSLTGLIVATALVRPSKKIADVKVKSVKKKFKDKSFAAGTRREDIALCEQKLGIALDEFIALSLEAMQGVSDELGL
jgi:putative nucleotidyltransferase with HDIG domain